jgi:hypothetical protein
LTSVGSYTHNERMKRGQALLVVMLVLGVAMTVGLSVVSRSITEVNISSTAEDSTRALEAAEAGIEKSLAGVGTFASGTVDHPTTNTFSENNAVVSVANISLGTASFYKLPYELESGDVATVDLGSSTVNSVRVCWGTDEGLNPVAEVMIYSTNGGSVEMRKWMIGPGFTTLGSNDTSKPCQGTSDPQIYNYRYSIDTSAIPGTLTMMRVRILGNKAHPFAFHLPSGNMPDQGKDTFSTGTAGGTSKKVKVTQLKPDIPFMFDSALFSGTSLVK